MSAPLDSLDAKLDDLVEVMKETPLDLLDDGDLDILLAAFARIQVRQHNRPTPGQRPQLHIV